MKPDAGPAAPVSRTLPPQTKYIIGNEACERLSYYGVLSILTLYTTRVLKLTPEGATEVSHWFKAAVYYLPLAGAWLADNWLGRYRTILYISCFYCLGHVTLALSEGSRGGLFAGLALIAIGSGGIKPCVAAFVGDQFKRSEQHLLAKAYGLFYWAVNFGGFFAFGLIPTVRENYGYRWAFGIPGIAMGVATLIFWLGSKHYVIVPPNREAGRRRILAVFWSAWRQRRQRPPGSSFLDGARAECTSQEVDEAKTLVGILTVFASAPIFWALYDQQNSTWVLQGGKMMAVSLFRFHLDPQAWRFVIPLLKLFVSEVGPGNFAFTLDSERMQSFNSLFVMIMIPAFTAWLYPFSERCGFKPTALRRMSVGMVLAALSFVACGWLQVRMDAGEKLSILWQVVPFLVVTAGEVLVSATALEFAFSQAPPSMKSLIMSFWLITIATGNALVAVFASLSEKVVHATEAGAFFFYAGLMGLVSLIFMACARRYQERPLA